MLIKKDNFRIKYMSILLILSTLMSVIACQSEGNEADSIGSSDEPITLIFACDEYQASGYENLVKQFEAENPNINIHIELIGDILGLDAQNPQWPEDAWQQLANSADVLCVVPTHNIVAEGLIQDLTPFMEQDTSFYTQDFYPNTLALFQWAGGTWGIPGSVDFNLIFYDKAIFDASGVAYPEPGWTWADFSEKVAALTERTADETTRWGFVQPWGLSLLISRIGALFDESTNPPTPLLDSSAVIAAVQWYTDLHSKNQIMPYFPPSDVAGHLSEGQVIIDQGKAAMWTDIASNFTWRSQQRDLGVAPYPVRQAQDETTPIFGSQVYVMSSGTAHPAKSWRWLNFLTYHLAAQPFGNSVPARRSIAESTKFWESLDAALIPTYRFALANSARQSLLRTDHFDDAVEAILAGEQDIITALAEAQTQTQRSLANQAQEKVEATPQPPAVATPIPKTGNEVVITFAAPFGNIAAYRDLAKSFNNTQSDIRVEVRSPNFNSSFGLTDMAKAGDCFAWFPVDGEMLHRNVFNLDPFLETETNFPLDDFYPQALEVFRWHNDIWALPADIRMQVLYYNKDLFDAAGVVYPQAGWSLDDFLMKAKFLTQGVGDEKQYGYVPVNGNTGDLPTFVATFGATWSDHSSDLARFRFNDPLLAEALQWYIDLAQAHQIVPIFPEEDFTRPSTVAWLKRQNLIQTGQAAMWISTVEFGSFSRIPKDINIGIAPLPLNQEMMPFSSVLGYYISKESAYPQHCWSWMTFLLEQSMEATPNLPPRRSVAESADFRAKVGDEVASAYLFSIERMQANQTPFGTVAIPGYKWLFEAYGQVITTGASVQTALEQAQNKATIYFTCLEAQAGFESEDLQKSCAKEADPEFVWFGEDDS